MVKNIKPQEWSSLHWCQKRKNMEISWQMSLWTMIGSLCSYNLKQILFAYLNIGCADDVLSLLCVAGHRGSSLAAALTVVISVALLGCDHYCRSWLCFELLMLPEKWTGSFDLHSNLLNGTELEYSDSSSWFELETPKEGCKGLPAQQMTASHWSGPSWEGACFIGTPWDRRNVALWSAKVFVSHYHSLLYFECPVCVLRLGSLESGTWICKSL